MNNDALLATARKMHAQNNRNLGGLDLSDAEVRAIVAEWARLDRERAAALATTPDDPDEGGWKM